MLLLLLVGIVLSRCGRLALLPLLMAPKGVGMEEMTELKRVLRLRLYPQLLQAPHWRLLALLRLRFSLHRPFRCQVPAQPQSLVALPSRRLPWREHRSPPRRLRWLLLLALRLRRGCRLRRLRLACLLLRWRLSNDVRHVATRGHGKAFSRRSWPWLALPLWLRWSCQRFR